MIDFDGEDGAITISNYDAASNFAKTYMPNLKQLAVFLRQEAVWTEEELNAAPSRYVDEFLEKKKPLISFTYDAFLDFLETVPLETFIIYCEPCTHRHVYDFTKDGKVFTALKATSLRRFTAIAAAIRNMNYLPLHANLKVLELSNVQFSKWSGEDGWSAEDSLEMVRRISELTQLEKLVLQCVPLDDHHLEPLLGKLSQLRSLEITGKSYCWCTTSRDGGFLTDWGCTVIGRLVPQLQYLSLSFQTNITVDGALQLVHACRDLRVLRLRGCCVDEDDALEIVQNSETLLLLRIDIDA